MPSREAHESPDRFLTTRWSRVVQAAQSADSAAKGFALEALCGQYWYPLYVFARRLGRSHHDAADLTQGFFSNLLERDLIDRADPHRGRFRTFLLVAFKAFMANERRAAKTVKRGGQSLIQSLDIENGDSRFQSISGHDETPEAEFERRWAVALIERSLGRLREEAVGRDRVEQFDLLKCTLTGESETWTIEELAGKCGLSNAATKVAIHRLRKRYGELLKAEVRETLEDPEDVDEELQHLFKALSRRT